MDKIISTEIAWHEVQKWNPDFIYPLPVGYMARNQAEYIVDGWKIFKQDPNAMEDILTVDDFPHAMTFTQALAICEMHNKERLVHDRQPPFSFITSKPRHTCFGGFTPADNDPNYKRKGKGKWVERK